MFDEKKTIPDVTAEIALDEITKWLNQKKVFQSVRDQQKENIDLLVEAMMNGQLVRESDNSLKYQLAIPLENEKPVREIRFAPRLNDRMLAPYLKGVSATDGDARLQAITAALTNEAKGIIASLDSVDKKICMAVAVFFI